jgi:hypothetical protein
MEVKPPEIQDVLGPSLLDPVESALVAAARLRAEQLGQAQDLSMLLFSLLVRPWSSLAIVSPGGDPDRAWRLTEKLVKAAQQSHYPALRAVNLLDLGTERASSIARTVDKLSALGERKRFIIALADPMASPIAVRVLAVCEAALLVLQRGRSRIPDARRTVQLIGRERIMGAVLCSR